ncbi:MAG: hypothetical protein LBD11_08350, partial [Candidatus Peribacteria bacterium]|nr:hypothetical protein [Candidatus Peribacteria bacterium]
EKFGNEEVNECLELIKSYNSGVIDGILSKQRKFAWVLIKKLKQLEAVERGKYTRHSTLELILKVISENEYYRTKITSPEKIHKSLATLMQVCKTDIQKHAKPKGVF